MGLTNSIRQHRRRWTIGAVIVILVVVFGGWGLIKLVQGHGDKPLTLADAPGGTTAGTTGTTSTGSDPGSGPSAGIDGTWTIEQGSTVGYRVKETLFGQSATATGRTTHVTGSIAVSGTKVTAGTFSVNVSTITSDRTQRDGQFRGRIMQVDQYPTATFTLTSPIDFSSVPATGATVEAKATGKLLLHGTTRTVTFTVNARRTATAIQVQGQIPVTFADYNIDNPSGGPAQVGNDGTLEFALAFTH